MPLIEIDAVTAWENVYRDWPNRLLPGGKESFIPFARPRIDNSFKLKPGAKVFTMGSCFARNIESYLETRGFEIVTKRYFGERHTINKYNTYTMLEEIKQALGIRRLTPEQRIIKLPDDNYMDIHLHSSSSLPWEHCIADMQTAADMYQEIFDCPYFVITLGLAEVWFDRENDTYINEPANFARYYRDDSEMKEVFKSRFAFRVLTFEESYSSTKELIELLRQASPECKIILTVSPVPLNATFTDRDVMIANMYSKSVLRTTAERIFYEHDFVDYFPSYESVMLSGRESTWEHDNVHVKQEAVETIMDRMLQTYVD